MITAEDLKKKIDETVACAKEYERLHDEISLIAFYGKFYLFDGISIQILGEENIRVLASVLGKNVISSETDKTGNHYKYFEYDGVYIFCVVLGENKEETDGKDG